MQAVTLMPGTMGTDSADLDGFSTISVYRSHFSSPVSLDNIASDLDRLKEKLSTGHVFSSDNIEHLSMCLHTFLFTADQENCSQLFDLYLNDTHCDTFRSLLRQSDNGLSFIKGLFKAFSYDFHERLTPTVCADAPTVYVVNTAKDCVYLHAPTNMSGQAFQRIKLLDVNGPPALTVKFIDDLLTFVVKIHTEIPSTACLFADHGAEHLLNLLNGIGSSIYLHHTFPSFLQGIKSGGDYAQHDKAIVSWAKYADVIDTKFYLLLRKVLEAEQRDIDNIYLLQTCDNFYLHRSAKLLLAKEMVDYVDERNERLQFKFLQRARCILSAVPLVPEEAKIQLLQYNKMNLSLLNDFISLNGFDVNVKDQDGATVISHLCVCFQEASRNLTQRHVDKASFKQMLLPVFQVLGNIGTHSSTTNATITEALLQFSPAYCQQGIYHTKEYVDAMKSLIRSKHFEINSRSLNWPRDNPMTFSHFAATRQLPLQVFLQHPDFDAMIADSKGNNILHTFMRHCSKVKQESEVLLKLLLDHSTSNVSKLNAKGKCVIDICISQYIGKTMTDETYIESTRLLCIHPHSFK